MNLNNRLQKLRQKQKQLTESLRQAEAKVSTRQRKALTRLKIIYGGAFMAMPEGEQEALKSMLLAHMTERDRHFVSEYEAGTHGSNEA